MKKHCFAPLLLAALSTLTAFRAGAQENRTLLLPPASGWYRYDIEMRFKGIEDERNFAVSTGMTMIQEITWKYTGVVCRFDDGVFFDPVAGLELSVGGEGNIACAGNLSIRGRLESGGGFFWGGVKEEHGRLNRISAKGTLTPLPETARGGREFDGIYHMIDTGTGREQIANISDGFYTWRYLDGEDAGFTPWPTLIQPGGSIASGMEITTVMEMGEFSKTNFSSVFLMEGKVIPGKGITLEEISRTSGMGMDQEEAPQIYAGTMIRAGEFPNEAIPQNIESLIRSGRAAARAEPGPNPAEYPAWYLELPVKPGFIYGAGEKTFDDRETAFSMAEAAASADIADQIRVRVESSIEESSSGGKERIDTRITSEALERLVIRIIRREYNEKTRTAFVLAETAVE